MLEEGLHGPCRIGRDPNDSAVQTKFVLSELNRRQLEVGGTVNVPVHAKSVVGAPPLKPQFNVAPPEGL